MQVQKSLTASIGATNPISKPIGPDSRKILYPVGSNDECITPAYGVEPILPYVHSGQTVWCPFDMAESQFVKLLRKRGVKVIPSHIKRGQDFLKWEPKEKWDVIISNPPFTNKRAMFERALSFGKPFALLMNIVWLNDTTPKKIFVQAGRQLQLLMLEQRIRFANPDGRPNDKVTFNTSYYCCDFLPRDIVIAEMEIPKPPKRTRAEVEHPFNKPGR